MKDNIDEIIAKPTECEQPVPDITPTVSAKCAHCGEPLHEKAVFCSKCGQKVEDPRCAQCHELLLPGASFCMLCGCPVSTQSDERLSLDKANTDTTPQVAVKRKGKGKWLCIIGGILVVVALGIAYMLTRPIDTSNPVYLTAAKYCEENWENAAKANDAYDGKYVCMTGIVKYIGTEFIYLTDDSATYPAPITIWCYPEDEIDLYDRYIGEYLSVWGVLSMGSSDTIKHCTFTEPYVEIDFTLVNNTDTTFSGISVRPKEEYDETVNFLGDDFLYPGEEIHITLEEYVKGGYIVPTFLDLNGFTHGFYEFDFDFSVVDTMIITNNDLGGFSAQFYT